jgi:hypothetical protein
LIHPQGRLTRVIADIVGEASLETPEAALAVIFAWTEPRWEPTSSFQAPTLAHSPGNDDARGLQGRLKQAHRPC